MLVDQAQLERLQRLAKTRPGAYRFKLTTTAVAGDALLTLTQIAPIAAPIVVGVLFYPHPVLIAAASAAVVFLIWLFRPQLRAQGRALAEHEAPELYRQLDALKARLSVPGRMEIYVDEALNASAGEGRGLFGLIGTRRVLTVGVPILACLDKDELLAVIAHELGHFSRRHGRLDNWLYRAHVGWRSYAQSTAEHETALDRAAAWYAGKFAPYFHALSLVHSRQCEYEADADAASLVGAAPFAGALTRIAVLAQLWERGLGRTIALWQNAEADAPADFYRRLASTVAAWPEAELNEWVADALHVRPGWTDTHPSLAERLAALGQTARLARIDVFAGQALLGRGWDRLLDEFNSGWLRDARLEWRIEHERYRHVVAPLLAAADGEVSNWPLERRIARARALRSLDPSRGKDELRAIHQREPDAPLAGFAYAAALLYDDDATGMAVMEQATQRDPALRVPGYARMLAYADRHADAAAVDRWSSRLEGAALRRAQCVAAFDRSLRAGNARPTQPAPDVENFLRAAAAADGSVECAWLLEGTQPLETSTPGLQPCLQFHVLVLRLEPAVLAQTGLYESRVREIYADVFARAVAPHAEVLVKTYSTFEPVPAYLADRPRLIQRPDADRADSVRASQSR